MNTSSFFSPKSPRHVAGVKRSRYIDLPANPELPEWRVKYEYAEALANDIGPMTPGRRVFAVLDGKFIFGDLLEAMAVRNNWHIEQMMISTLSLSENNIDSLRNMLDGGYVDMLDMIVSDYFYAHERGGLVPYIYERLDIGDRFQLAVAGTHTKICLIRMRELRIVIHGSANLRSSSNIEQVMIEESAPLYDFLHEMHAGIVEAYKTIRKPVRYERAWQAAAASAAAGKPRSQPETAPPGKGPRSGKKALREAKF